MQIIHFSLLLLLFLLPSLLLLKSKLNLHLVVLCSRGATEFCAVRAAIFENDGAEEEEEATTGSGRRGSFSAGVDIMLWPPEKEVVGRARLPLRSQVVVLVGPDPKAFFVVEDEVVEGEDRDVVV